MLIEEYLQSIFEQLKLEVADMQNLCSLKNVNYHSGNIPDYADRAVQLLYCLKYHFGYACEYECMYEDVLNKIKEKDKISVLSIGCGNGIDLWSLQSFLNRSNRNIAINYFGVDSIDWCNKVTGRENDNVRYINCNVCDLNDEIPEINNIDILIFPKSISEMKETDLRCIANFVSAKTNELFVMASYRTSNYYLNNDIDKIRNLCKCLKDEEYVQFDGNLDTYYSFDDKIKGVRSMYKDYVYPYEAKEYISKLYVECASFNKENDNCNKCTDVISRQPILTLNNIAYNWVKYERN